jgi:hypothetical protein
LKEAAVTVNKATSVFRDPSTATRAPSVFQEHKALYVFVCNMHGSLKSVMAFELVYLSLVEWNDEMHLPRSQEVSIGVKRKLEPLVEIERCLV